MLSAREKKYFDFSTFLIYRKPTIHSQNYLIFAFEKEAIYEPIIFLSFIVIFVLAQSSASYTKN